MSDRSMRAFAKLPAAVLDTPVETFVARTPAVADLSSDLRPLFKGRSGNVRLIGDLEPDLVIRTPNELVVWDLTSVERQGHMAKNFLYQAVLNGGSERSLVGETYWRHFGKTTTEIEALYPKEVRAARAQRAIARKIMELHAQGKKP